MSMNEGRSMQAIPFAWQEISVRSCNEPSFFSELEYVG
ncbi:hypothetical protein ABID08_006278 [Rhizobium binae]|uniref:Uncharacterized protein n=1 Tax=Rhizobium binae TaxID=1138190 RepID=A0ABV2MR06_9HYPH